MDTIMDTKEFKVNRINVWGGRDSNPRYPCEYV